MKTVNHNVAIVGAGLMGGWHAHYARLAGANIAGIVDPDLSRGRALCLRYREAQAFSSISELEQLQVINAVHVCTPSGTHQTIILSALKNRWHVLVEKPFTETIDECEELISAATSRNLQLTAVHQLSFCRGFKKLMERRQSLGELVAVHYQLNSAGADGKSERGCEILHEMLPHPLSVLFRLTGGQLSPAQISLVHHSRTRLELIASSTPRCSVVLDLMARPTRHELVVYGTNGTAYVDFFHDYCFFERGTVSRTSKILLPFEHSSKRFLSAGGNLIIRSLTKQPAYPGLASLIKCFYGSLHGECDLPVSHEELRFVAHCLEQLQASISA